jgi:hypothetical protein
MPISTLAHHHDNVTLRCGLLLSLLASTFLVSLVLSFLCSVFPFPLLSLPFPLFPGTRVHITDASILISRFCSVIVLCARLRAITFGVAVNVVPIGFIVVGGCAKVFGKVSGETMKLNAADNTIRLL